MKRQSGITLGGMMLFMLVLIMAVYTISRVAPGYMDYWTVSRTLDNLAAQSGIQSRSDESIRDQFAKQLNMNNITEADRSDLLIERIPGGVRLSAAFSAKRPLFGAVSLCLDFHAEASSATASGN